MISTSRCASLLFYYSAVIAVAVLVLVSSSSSLIQAHMFKSENVEELTPQTMGKFLSTHKAAYIALYATWCGHCRNLVNDWQKAAKSMKGTVKFGAIDADKYRDIAQKYGVQGFPTIKKWAMGSKKGVQPQDYQGQRTAAAIQSDALSMIKHKTTTVTSVDQLVKTTAKTSLKKAFVLFTNKDKVAPLYNVLSYSPHYDGKIAFVVVKTQNKKVTGDVVNAVFGSEKNLKVPSMQLISLNEAGTEIDKESIVEYTDKVEYNTIAKYLLDVAQGGSNNGEQQQQQQQQQGNEEASTEQQQQKETETKHQEQKQPPKKALPVSVTPLTKDAIVDYCSGTAHGRKQPFCVVMFANPQTNDQQQQQGAVPEDVFKTFSQDSVLIFTTDNDAAFANAKKAFSNGAPNTTGALKALVFRTTEKKVTKYLWVDGQRNQDLENAISRILDGSSRMNKSNEGVFEF